MTTTSTQEVLSGSRFLQQVLNTEALNWTATLPEDAGDYYGKQRLNYPNPEALFTMVILEAFDKQVVTEHINKYGNSLKLIFQFGVGDIGLTGIYKQTYRHQGSFLGIQITGHYNDKPLRAMVKKDRSIDLGAIRGKISRLQASYDVHKAERDRAEAQRSLGSNRVGKLIDALREQYGRQPNSPRYTLERGFGAAVTMKLDGLTNEQIMFIGEIMQAWQPSEVN